MGYLKRVYHRASEGVGEKVFLFSVYMVALFWEKDFTSDKARHRH